MEEGYGAQRAHLRRLQQTRDELAQRLDILRMMVQGQQDQLAREEEVMNQLSSVGRPSGASVVRGLRRTANNNSSNDMAGPQILIDMANAPARDSPGNQARRFLAGISHDTLDDDDENGFTNDANDPNRIRLLGRARDSTGTAGFVFQAGGGHPRGGAGAGGGPTPSELVESLETAMMLHAIRLSLEAVEAKPSVPGISDKAKEQLVSFHLTKENLKTRLAERTSTKMKKSAASEDLNSIGSKDCAICQECMDWLTYCTELPCGHFFCHECIMPWLEKTRTCPICRVEVLEDSNTAEKKPKTPPPRDQTRTLIRHAPDSTEDSGTTVIVPPSATMPQPTTASPTTDVRLPWSASPPPQQLQQATAAAATSSSSGSNSFMGSEPPQNGSSRFFPSVWRGSRAEDGTIVNSSNTVASPNTQTTRPVPPAMSGEVLRQTLMLEAEERRTRIGNTTTIDPLRRHRSNNSILDSDDDENDRSSAPGLTPTSTFSSGVNRSSGSTTATPTSTGASTRQPRHTTSMRSTGGGGRVNSVRSSVQSTRDNTGTRTTTTTTTTSSTNQQQQRAPSNMSTTLTQQRRGPSRNTTTTTTNGASAAGSGVNALRRAPGQGGATSSQPTRPTRVQPTSTQASTHATSSSLSETDRAVIAALNPLMRSQRR